MEQDEEQDVSAHRGERSAQEVSDAECTDFVNQPSSSPGVSRRFFPTRPRGSLDFHSFASVVLQPSAVDVRTHQVSADLSQ